MFRAKCRDILASHCPMRNFIYRNLLRRPLTVIPADSHALINLGHRRIECLPKLFACYYRNLLEIAIVSKEGRTEGISRTTRIETRRIYLCHSIILNRLCTSRGATTKADVKRQKCFESSTGIIYIKLFSFFFFFQPL